MQILLLLTWKKRLLMLLILAAIISAKPIHASNHNRPYSPHFQKCLCRGESRNNWVPTGPTRKFCLMWLVFSARTEEQKNYTRQKCDGESFGRYHWYRGRPPSFQITQSFMHLIIISGCDSTVFLGEAINPYLEAIKVFHEFMECCVSSDSHANQNASMKHNQNCTEWLHQSKLYRASCGKLVSERMHLPASHMETLEGSALTHVDIKISSLSLPCSSTYCYEYQPRRTRPLANNHCPPCQACGSDGKILKRFAPTVPVRPVKWPWHHR